MKEVSFKVTFFVTLKKVLTNFGEYRKIIDYETDYKK